MRWEKETNPFKNKDTIMKYIVTAIICFACLKYTNFIDNSCNHFGGEQ